MALKHVKRALAAGAGLALAAATLAAASAARPSAQAAASPAGALSGAKTKPKVKFPKGWVGVVKYDYTHVDGGDTYRASETASVTFSHIKGKAAYFYEITVGKITWQASAEEPTLGCVYTGAGERAINQYDGFLEISPRAPYRGFFSSPDNLEIVVLRTCGNEASEDNESISHPFFLLFRKVAGVPVDKKLRTLAGTSNGSTSSESGSDSWKYSWNFRAIR